MSTAGEGADSGLKKGDHIKVVPVVGLQGSVASLTALHPDGGDLALELIWAPWSQALPVGQRVLIPCNRNGCPCMNPGERAEIRNGLGGAWVKEVAGAEAHAMRRHGAALCEIDMAIFSPLHAAIGSGLHRCGAGEAAYLTGGRCIAVSGADGDLADGVLGLFRFNPVSFEWFAHDSATIRQMYGGGGAGGGG